MKWGSKKHGNGEHKSLGQRMFGIFKEEQEVSKEK